MRIQPKKTYPWYVRWLFRKQEKKYGCVLDSSKIWARVPRLFLSISAFFGAIERKNSPIPPELRDLLIVRVSQINTCSFCINLNSPKIHSKEKLAKLASYTTSPFFTETEKAALNYAEAMTYTDKEVSDALFNSLKEHFSDDEIVEITAIVAFQNCSTKFNSALNI